jgi:hypothetical protein
MSPTGGLGPRRIRVLRPSQSLEKIACGDFFEPVPHCRRQKAWFLPPTSSRSYARAGDFFEPVLRLPAVKSVVFAAYLIA